MCNFDGIVQLASKRKKNRTRREKDFPPYLWYGGKTTERELEKDFKKCVFIKKENFSDSPKRS